MKTFFSFLIVELVLFATPSFAQPTAKECIQALLAKPLPTGLLLQDIVDPRNGRPGFGVFAQTKGEEQLDLLPVAQIHFSVAPKPGGVELPAVTYNVSVDPSRRREGLGRHLVALTLDTAVANFGPVAVKNSLEKLNLQIFVLNMIGYLGIDCPVLREKEVPTTDPIYPQIMGHVVKRGAAAAPGSSSTVPLLARMPWHDLFHATPDGKILSALGYHLSELNILIDPEKPDQSIMVLPSLSPERPEHSITRIHLPNQQFLQQMRRTEDGAVFAQSTQ